MSAAPTPNPGAGFDPDRTHPQPGQAFPPDVPRTHPTSHPAPSDRRAEEDPGKVLGIVSLVASLSTFIGFNVVGPVIGIITGHMARSRSKADGRADNEMGKWGLILGIVFLALLAFGWMLGISAGIVGGMVSLLGA